MASIMTAAIIYRMVSVLQDVLGEGEQDILMVGYNERPVTCKYYMKCLMYMHGRISRRVI